MVLHRPVVLAPLLRTYPVPMGDYFRLARDSGAIGQGWTRWADRLLRPPAKFHPLILPLLLASCKIVGCWHFSFRFTDCGLEALLVEGSCRDWGLLRYFDSGGYLRQQFLLRRRGHFFAGTSSPPLSHPYGRAH
jgi:hypothetical protein